LDRTCTRFEWIPNSDACSTDRQTH
jgi:hypothetical protein